MKWKTRPISVLSKHIKRHWGFFKAYKFFSRQAEYPVYLDESTLNEDYKRFGFEFMSDCCTVDHIHKQIKELKIHRNKSATPKQKAFILMYSCYTDFPGDFETKNLYLFFLATLATFCSILIK